MQDVKIKIPLGERDRYITMTGDPIQHKTPRSLFLRAEFLAAVACAAGGYISDPKIMAVVVPLAMGLGLLTQRKSRLKDEMFYSSQAWPKGPEGGRLVIDTKPDRAVAIASLNNYRPHIEKQRDNYWQRLKWDAKIAGVFGTAGAYLITPGFFLANSLIYVGTMVADARSINRFNKLAKAEWAIVEEPPLQEKIKNDLEINVPVPLPAPRPAVTPGAAKTMQLSASP